MNEGLGSAAWSGRSHGVNPGHGGGNLRLYQASHVPFHCAKFKGHLSHQMELFKGYL